MNHLTAVLYRRPTTRAPSSASSPLTIRLHPQRIGSSIPVGFRTRFLALSRGNAQQLTVAWNHRGARLGCEHRRILHITAPSPHGASDRHRCPRRSSLRPAPPRPRRSHGLGFADSVSHDCSWRGRRKRVDLHAQLDSSVQCRSRCRTSFLLRRTGDLMAHASAPPFPTRRPTTSISSRTTSLSTPSDTFRPPS